MLPYMWASQDKCFESVTAQVVNGDTLFTITGGPILIQELVSVCVTANAAVASTLQYSSTPTVGSAKTFSGASASLVSATAGTIVRLNPTALTTAPDIITAANGGVVLGGAVANRIIVKEGIITAVVGVGTMTGTWKHLIRYSPLSPNSLIAGN